MATVAAAEAESKTYWCHECDMSVSLTSSQSHSSPLLCPHCNTHFLELMDYSQNDAAPQQPFHSLFDSPFLHRLVSTTTTTNQNDAVLEDPLSLLSPTTLTSNSNKPRAADTLPAIPVTPSLLSRLDLNGVVLCAVCKDEIGVNDEAKLLPCNHLYHSDCITPWLAHHDSCPLCRFRISESESEEEEEEGDGGGGGDASRTGEIRRQLRAAMMRLSELMEEEEDDFYGLRITLNHIASRHGLLHQDSNGSRVSESVTVTAGDEQLP